VLVTLSSLQHAYRTARATKTRANTKYSYLMLVVYRLLIKVSSAPALSQGISSEQAGHIRITLAPARRSEVVRGRNRAISPRRSYSPARMQDYMDRIDRRCEAGRERARTQTNHRKVFCQRVVLFSLDKLTNAPPALSFHDRRKMAEQSAASYDPSVVRRAAAAPPPAASVDADASSTPMMNGGGSGSTAQRRRPLGVGTGAGSASTAPPPQYLGLMATLMGGGGGGGGGGEGLGGFGGAAAAAVPLPKMGLHKLNPVHPWLESA
jgi:hypothetical protein